MDFSLNCKIVRIPTTEMNIKSNLVNTFLVCIQTKWLIRQALTVSWVSGFTLMEHFPSQSGEENSPLESFLAE